MKQGFFLEHKAVSWVLWFYLVSLVIVTYLSKFANPYALDDLAVLRASSYVSAFPNDPLLDDLKIHLSDNRIELGEEYFGRYQYRFDFFGNYILSDYLILFLESFPIYSAYQSVFAAAILFYFIALVFFGLILRWQMGTGYRLLLSFMIISVIPKIFGVFEIYMFGIRQDDWLNILPRSPLFLLMFSAYIINQNPGNKPISSTLKRLILGLLLVVGFFLHRSMAVMYFLMGFIVLAVYRMIQADPVSWVQGKRLRSLLVPYNLSLIIIALIKYIFFVNLGVTRIGPNLYGVSWVILVNILIYLWIRQKKDVHFQHATFSSIGDCILILLVPVSVITLGLDLVILDPGILRWSNQAAFFVMEISARLSPAIHFMWWLMFGIVVYFYLNASWGDLTKGEKRGLLTLIFLPLILSPKIGNLLVVVIGILVYYFIKMVNSQKRSIIVNISMIAMLGLVPLQHFRSFVHGFFSSRSFENAFDCDLLHIKASTYLGEFGVDAYKDEITYFHSIANQMRAEHFPNALVSDHFGCRVIPNPSLNK